MGRRIAGVRLINTPSSPSCAAISVLWEQKQEGLTESDSRWKAVVIRLAVLIQEQITLLT